MVLSHYTVKLNNCRKIVELNTIWMKININKDNKVSEAQNRNFTTKQEKLPYLIFDVRP